MFHNCPIEIWFLFWFFVDFDIQQIVLCDDNYIIIIIICNKSANNTLRILLFWMRVIKQFWMFNFSIGYIPSHILLYWMPNEYNSKIVNNLTRTSLWISEECYFSSEKCYFSLLSNLWIFIRENSITDDSEHMTVEKIDWHQIHRKNNVWRAISPITFVTR